MWSEQGFKRIYHYKPNVFVGGTSIDVRRTTLWLNPRDTRIKDAFIYVIKVLTYSGN